MNQLMPRDPQRRPYVAFLSAFVLGLLLSFLPRTSQAEIAAPPGSCSTDVIDCRGAHCCYEVTCTILDGLMAWICS